MPTERLSDEDCRTDLGQRGHRVSDVRVPGDVGRPAFARAVASRVEGEDVVIFGQPPSRRGPLGRVATQPVQQEHRIAGSAEIVQGEAGAVG